MGELAAGIQSIINGALDLAGDAATMAAQGAEAAADKLEAYILEVTGDPGTAKAARAEFMDRVL